MFLRRYRRTIVALLFVSTTFIASTFAAEPQPAKPSTEKSTSATSTAQTSAPWKSVSREWKPGDTFIPPSKDEFTLVINVFYSPMDTQGYSSNAPAEKLFLSEDLAREWGWTSESKTLYSSNIILSQPNITCFTQFCCGATNFTDACNGDVFVKVIRRKNDGKWESDITWNVSAPFVRLKPETTSEAAKERLEALFAAIAPDSPKAKAFVARRAAEIAQKPVAGGGGGGSVVKLTKE